MIFNILLFKNANYQINYIERAQLYDKHEWNYLCTSTQDFRKAICVKNKKIKLNILSKVSFIVPTSLPCIVTMPPLINPFGINILKAFGDDVLGLCKPAK